MSHEFILLYNILKYPLRPLFFRVCLMYFFLFLTSIVAHSMALEGKQHCRTQFSLHSFYIIVNIIPVQK